MNHFEESNDDDHRDDSYVYNLQINSSAVCKKCAALKEEFKFNNKFHDHIRKCKSDAEVIKNLVKISFNFKNLFVVCLSASKIANNDYAFRSYQYVTV